MNTTTPAKLEQFKTALTTLTPFEIEAVKQAYASSYGNGHDFGYAEDISVPGVKARGNGGVIASLVKKGVLVWDSQFGQIGFLEFGDTYEAAKIVKETFNIAY